MPAELVDTHCHLDLEPLAQSVEDVLGRARAAGVRQCISIGTTVEASRANVELAGRHAGVHAAVGVHPNEAGSVTDETVAAIEALAAHPHVVAIGEIGLDHYRTHADPGRQREALAGFLGIAGRRKLPVIIHCRDAYEPLLRVFRDAGQPDWRGVIHCASGPPEFIQEALVLGFHVSFAGNVTFPNAESLRRLVPLVPDDRLLVETDSPFLAPQPVRGRVNEPAHVAHTAAFLAQLRGIPVDALSAFTTANARRLFGLPQPGG
jgi:TatD DNase family protein